LGSSHREIRNLATGLFEHNQRLLTFLDHEGVEPPRSPSEKSSFVATFTRCRAYLWECRGC
jgi:hypothetical protein